MYTAFTEQIDDPEAAVREILEQLKPEENKLKNTIGIVHFYHEFVETDVCKAIAAALHFDTVGGVSSYVGTADRYGDIALTVTMLTSDDVNFSIRVVEDVSAKPAEQVTDEVTRMCAELCAKEQPKLVMPFLAMGRYFTGDNLVNIVNALPEPFPLYGTVAFNMNMVEGTHFTMLNDKASSDMHVFVALYGNIEPKFHIVSAFFDEDFQSGFATITGAEESVLKSIDGISTLQYLKEHRIISGTSTLVVLPAVLIYPNGTQVVRAFPGLVEGTEFFWATGSIKEGGKIKFAHLDSNKTVVSAEHIMKELTKLKENDVMMYSCVARVWSLGKKYFAEAQEIVARADDYQQTNNVPLNYSLAYSGGEICPIWDKDGKMINILHNYTLVACTFS
jgi:hypothetical protein